MHKYVATALALLGLLAIVTVSAPAHADVLEDIANNNKAAQIARIKSWCAAELNTCALTSGCKDMFECRGKLSSSQCIALVKGATVASVTAAEALVSCVDRCVN